MFKMATATYHNNTLCLDKNFSFNEGSKLKVIIWDEGKRKKQNFFDFVSKNRIEIPTDYSFDREEINER